MLGRVRRLVKMSTLLDLRAIDPRTREGNHDGLEVT
jgi:hypothetical protein